MCLIFFSINQHKNYKLIIAANRDEFYNRKTAPADFWQDHPDVLGGRDLEAQGTWMAMTKAGKIAMVTNYRDPQNINPNAPSRGQLVSNYLIGSKKPEDYLKGIEPTATQYNGFNLLIGTVDDLWYLSNYKSGVDFIQPGFYGLSNHLLETPWPKVEEGKKILTLILDQHKIEPTLLLDLIHNEAIAEDDKLPYTGLSLERERALSSMFIKTEGYGTRCSTVVLIDHQNQVEFVERVYDTQTRNYNEQKFAFKM